MNPSRFILRSLLGGFVVLGGVSALAGHGHAAAQTPRPTVGAPLLVAPRQHPPRLPGPRFGTSQNWAGYAAYNQSDVQGVQASWTVPMASSGLNCPGKTYSATWVGIDGYSNGTVEQLGTEQDYVNGQPTYYAWWEMYPHPSYYVTVNGQVAQLNAGDSITASVIANRNGTFTLTMRNNSRGWSFSTTQKLPSAKRTSAEWIEEAPFSGGIVPLTNFGSVNFTGCLAAIGSPTLSTPLMSCSPLDPISMADSNGNPQTTAPSPTSSSSFSLQWVNCR